LVCQRVPKKSAILACLAMSKLKTNQRVPSKNADLLKKISLMGTEELAFPFGTNKNTLESCTSAENNINQVIKSYP